MSDSAESAAEAAAREAAERFDTGTMERPLPMNAARQSAFVSGAIWKSQQDESEAAKVAAQRAVEIDRLRGTLQLIQAMCEPPEPEWFRPIDVNGNPFPRMVDGSKILEVIETGYTIELAREEIEKLREYNNA